MSNSWFRMYAEFANDPKVQMMTEADQRRFVMLLCMRCGNDSVTLQDEEIAFQLRISPDEWAQTKGRFLSKNLITEDNQPVAWERRQFVSDSSAERVRKHRAKKKEGVQQPSNVTATPPDTDTDTDIKPSSARADHAGTRFPEFWEAWPGTDRKAAKAECLKKWKLRGLDALADEILRHIEAMKPTRKWQDGYEPAPLTYLNQRRWEDGLPTGDGGVDDFMGTAI